MAASMFREASEEALRRAIECETRHPQMSAYHMRMAAKFEARAIDIEMGCV